MGKERVVLVTGIGCHGKMADYINVSSFYALHGRTIPVATGIKSANNDLQVICCAGDGDVYNEGISHLLHAAKRNSNITVIVHDNHVFSLTVKQPTSTSPEGFTGSSTPEGHPERPLNPVDLMLSVKASFVARSFVGKQGHLKEVIKEGIEHKGFSFIEVLQPCVAWYNTFPEYAKRVYEMKEIPSSFKEAREKAQEWDYSNEADIPLGVFYKEQKEVLEDKLEKTTEVDIGAILEKSK